jgi:hypothetical protein
MAEGSQARHRLVYVSVAISTVIFVLVVACHLLASRLLRQVLDFPVKKDQ